MPELESKIENYKSDYDFENGRQNDLTPNVNNTVLQFKEIFESRNIIVKGGSKLFRAKFTIEGTAIVKDQLYYIDSGHKGYAAEIEIFDKSSKKHFGAMTLEAKYKPNSRVPGRFITP